jgi:lysozyme
MESLADQLIRHEGLELHLYKCTGTPPKVTIGVGRNIQDNGITEAEARFMLDTDIERSRKELETFYWWKDLDEVRKDCLINMVFNLGFPTFNKFKGLISDLEDKNYKMASLNMLDSRWAKQVKGRAKELAEQMRTGERQNG